MNRLHIPSLRTVCLSNMTLKSSLLKNSNVLTGSLGFSLSTEQQAACQHNSRMSSLFAKLLFIHRSVWERQPLTSHPTADQCSQSVTVHHRSCGSLSTKTEEKRQWDLTKTTTAWSGSALHQ